MRHKHYSECNETLDLRLFDGEGGEGTGGDTGAAADAQQTGDPAELSENGTAAADAENTAETPEQRYERLIADDPEMKAVYEKRFQREIGRRMKGARAMQAELEELRPIADLLRTTRGAADNRALLDMLKNDKSTIAEEAAKLGMTEDGYVKYRDAIVRQDADENARKNALIAQYNEALDRELDELTQIYPDADPDELRSNEEFMELMRLPKVSARHAYEVLHASELFANVAREGVRRGKQMAAEAMRSRQSRPAENISGARGAGKVEQIDISKLSPKQMDEYERQALRGHKVSFA